MTTGGNLQTQNTFFSQEYALLIVGKGIRLEAKRKCGVQ